MNFIKLCLSLLLTTIFFLLAHDSCQGDSGGPLMNIREENGESKYEWVGKFALKYVLFITLL